MILDRVTLREIRMPLVHFFETSFGRTTERRILLVEVESEGATGWGEVTAGEGPFYNEEWVDAAWLVLRDFVVPRILHQEVGSAAKFAARMPPIRGHQMARAGLETAVWELEARALGRPLWQHIGGARTEIPCGVSIGIQDSIEELQQLIERETTAFYQRIKIKIKPGWDVDVVRKVREQFRDIQLMADANSAYTLQDTERLKRLDEFHLMMIEQPLAHDDIIDHATLQAQLKDAGLPRRVHPQRPSRPNRRSRLRACRVINIKLGRVGGFSEALLIHNVARANPHSRLVWRDARKRRRPRQQYCPLHARQLPTSRGCFRQQTLLATGHHRSSRQRDLQRDDSSSRPTGLRLQLGPRLRASDHRPPGDPALTANHGP